MLSSCSSLETPAKRDAARRDAVAEGDEGVGERAEEHAQRSARAAPRRRSTALACARPTLRGLAPTSTKETPVMMSAGGEQHAATMLSRRNVNASVTSTAAVVSARMRMKFTALTCAPVSSAIARSERAAPRADRRAR